MEIEPARDGIAELYIAVRPVVRDVQDLLDERIRVVRLERGLREKAREPEGRGDADRELPAIEAHDRFPLVVVVVARLDDPHERRDRPRVVAESVAGGEREVLKRRLPAVALVRGDVRYRRRRRAVLVPREDVREAEGRGETLRDPVVRLEEQRERLGLTDGKREASVNRRPVSS